MEVKKLEGHPQLSVDYQLREGNKLLTLRLNFRAHVASSKIENVEGEREKGATTALYRKALEIMQEEADGRGVLKYTFGTNNPLMRAWALAPQKGAGVFHWDKVYDREVLLTATKYVKPRSPF